MAPSFCSIRATAGEVGSDLAQFLKLRIGLVDTTLTDERVCLISKRALLRAKGLRFDVDGPGGNFLALNRRDRDEQADDQHRNDREEYYGVDRPLPQRHRPNAAERLFQMSRNLRPGSSAGATAAAVEAPATAGALPADALVCSSGGSSASTASGKGTSTVGILS